MAKGPGLYTDIGKKARDLLYKDYQTDQKFTFTTYSPTGVVLLQMPRIHQKMPCHPAQCFCGLVYLCDQLSLVAELQQFSRMGKEVHRVYCQIRSTHLAEMPTQGLLSQLSVELRACKSILMRGCTTSGCQSQLPTL